MSAIPDPNAHAVEVRVFDRRRKFDGDGFDPSRDLDAVMNAGGKGGWSGAVRIKSIRPAGDRYTIKFESGNNLNVNLRFLLSAESIRQQCEQIHEGKTLFLPTHVTDEASWRTYLLTLLEKTEVADG